MSEDIVNDAQTEEIVTETQQQEEPVQEEAVFDPKKRYDVGDDPKFLVEKIKYENRQKKASDARNKMYWDMIQKQQERLDALEARTQESDLSSAKTAILQKIQEARELGETDKEAKLLEELVELKVQDKLKPAKKQDLPPEVKRAMNDPDFSGIVERMNERDERGNLARPWMHQGHPKFEYAQAQANLIEAEMIEETGDFNLEEALDRLDQVMSQKLNPQKQQKTAPSRGPDPMAGGNLTNTKQRATIKLSPEEEFIAQRLGIAPDKYLASKQKLQAAGKLK